VLPLGLRPFELRKCPVKRSPYASLRIRIRYGCTARARNPKTQTFGDRVSGFFVITHTAR
jgi:hypothetical protein